MSAVFSVGAGRYGGNIFVAADNAAVDAVADRELKSNGVGVVLYAIRADFVVGFDDVVDGFGRLTAGADFAEECGGKADTVGVALVVRFNAVVAVRADEVRGARQIFNLDVVRHVRGGSVGGGA